MKIDPEKPISSLHKELIGIQESVLSGDMSETGLSNWFFQFCEDVGCPVHEVQKRKVKKFPVDGDDWCCNTHGWMACDCDPSIHDCTKRT
jgi:hypothetical protein